MRRRALFAAALFAAIAAGCSSSPADPYAAYRQNQVEDIPGSFDWQLQPVARDNRATIPPQVAYEEVYGAGREPEALAILGQVHNAVEDSTGPPAWIFVTPHTCFATAKGDLVSPGRSGDGCTDDNLYVQGVDATTGETLGGFTAYDTPLGWTPTRTGTPDGVVATTQEGSTRLH